MIALLDKVIEMIEKESRPRWRTDPDLRVGDWIQFDEEFRQTTEAPDAGYPLPSGNLRYLDANEDGEQRFILYGSDEHFIDPYKDEAKEQTEATTNLIRRLLGDDDATTADKVADTAPVSATSASSTSSRHPVSHLAGHARVTTVQPDLVFATPLYVEHAPR